MHSNREKKLCTKENLHQVSQISNLETLISRKIHIGSQILATGMCLV